MTGRDPSMWLCEAHRLWTSTDCPSCDSEQIADLERLNPMPSCRKCQRTFIDGEDAWADDVKVIEPDGVRLETRYTCDDCEAAQ